MDSLKKADIKREAVIYGVGKSGRIFPPSLVGMFVTSVELVSRVEVTEHLIITSLLERSLMARLGLLNAWKLSMRW